MNLFKQYPSHMRSQTIFKTSKRWRFKMVLRMFKIPHILCILANFFSINQCLIFFWPSIENPLMVMNLFIEHANHMRWKLFFKNFKEEEIWECTKNVRIPHILCSLPHFLVFFIFIFWKSIEHPWSVMNLFKQYMSHMGPQTIFKTSRKWRFGKIWRMWGFFTFFVPLLNF